MPACHVAREERLGRAIYTLRGKLDGATALDLRRRLEEERLPAVLLDFSQVEDFADYGVSVLAQAMNGPRSPRLTGLRQHTLRLFEYFGVDVRSQGSRPGSGRPDFKEPKKRPGA